MLVAARVVWSTSSESVYDVRAEFPAHGTRSRLAGIGRPQNGPDFLNRIFTGIDQRHATHFPFGVDFIAVDIGCPLAGHEIHDAVGIRLKELPFTPDKVIKALKEKEQQNKKGKDKQ